MVSPNFSAVQAYASLLHALAVLYVLSSCQCDCSAEKQDATESWVPCAVKRVRFHTKEEQALIQQELSALRAVQGAAHLIQYMSHAEIIIDSITYMYIVTRYALYSILPMF